MGSKKLRLGGTSSSVWKSAPSSFSMIPTTNHCTSTCVFIVATDNTDCLFAEFTMQSRDEERSDNRILDLMTREKESINRILNQAELKTVIARLNEIKKKIESIESKLSGSD